METTENNNQMCKMKKRVIPQIITELMPNEIFVFGSNIGGLHGGGAARTAMQWGAVWGQGVGLQGQTYAIPTMDGSVGEIKPYVDEFIECASQNPDKVFMVTEIGCGIAGYTPAQIAPLFAEATKIENIHLPQSFWEIISEEMLEYMSLAELEQTIIKLWNENSRKNRPDLYGYLSERKYRINKYQPITAQELTELKRVNRLITKHTFRVCAEVEELFEKLKTNTLPNYNELTVKAELYPSYDLMKFDGDENSNYEAMGEILSDEVFGMSYKYLLEISMSCNRGTGEERTDYMCFYDEDTRMWDNLFDFTFKNGEISEEDAFEVYYPMHALYDHSPYSLQDIIRISDFESKITVTFE